MVKFCCLFFHFFSLKIKYTMVTETGYSHKNVPVTHTRIYRLHTQERACEYNISCSRFVLNTGAMVRGFDEIIQLRQIRPWTSRTSWKATRLPILEAMGIVVVQKANGKLMDKVMNLYLYFRPYLAFRKAFQNCNSRKPLPIQLDCWKAFPQG